MSANRMRTGNEPGLDCPSEITFAEFIRVCTRDPYVRVQGKADGRRRFNRSVEVLTETATASTVMAQRVRWNWRAKIFDNVTRPDGTPWLMTLEWDTLDWVTTQACNDPNGTWMKVTTRG